MNLDSGRKEQVQPRLIMCPQCHQRFETMRRFQMVCTECGHEWQETSVLTWRDKMSNFGTEAWGYAFLGFAWASVLGIAIFLFLMLGLVILRIADRGGVGAALVVGAILAGIVIFTAVLLRPRMEASERLQWWVTPWQGPRRDR